MENSIVNSGVPKIISLSMEKIDFFISHASEDKDNFVRGLADALIRSGANVFYDEYSIKLGDSLTESINHGISLSKYGIIVLSKYFFEKGWTNAELQSLLNKAIREKYKLLIIYHDISHTSVAIKYPLLSDIKGINSSEGIYKITNEIFDATNFIPKIGFGTTNFNLPLERINEGLSFTIRIAFPLLGSISRDKVFFELGCKDKFHSRFRLYLFRNHIIYFDFIDKNYRKFSIAANVSDWIHYDAHIVTCNLDVLNKKQSLFIDGIKVSETILFDVVFEEIILSNAKIILGSNLELDYTSPFIISHFDIGTSLGDEQIVAKTEIIKGFNDILNR